MVSFKVMERREKNVKRKKGVHTQEEKDKMNKSVSPKYQNIYYVYECLVDGVVKYIGMGKGKRIEHCKSGKSSCSELNKDFHAGKKIEVRKIETDLTKSEAQDLEMSVIWSYEEGELYNKERYPNLSSRPMIGMVNGIEVIDDEDGDKILKQLAKASPDVNQYNFDNLAHWLKECGLNIYIAKVGSTKTLVLDKPYSRAYDYLHLGCPNWPNCSEVGCGG